MVQRVSVIPTQAGMTEQKAVSVWKGHQMAAVLQIRQNRTVPLAFRGRELP
jgi:hypothetical protein